MFPVGGYVVRLEAERVGERVEDEGVDRLTWAVSEQ